MNNTPTTPKFETKAQERKRVKALEEIAGVIGIPDTFYKIEDGRIKVKIAGREVEITVKMEWDHE
jgi:hypothetical protein